MAEKKVFKGLESIPAALEDLEKHKPLLSPEMQESFDLLLEKAQSTSGAFIKYNANWSLFQLRFKGYNSAAQGDLLEARRTWIEMRKNGDVFNQYLRDSLEKTITENYISEAFRLFDVYTSLNGATDPKFVVRLLGHRNILVARDNSIVSSIMESLVASREPAVVPEILDYIENMFSSEYGRKDFLDGDLWQATSALVSIVGKDEASKLLNQQAEESASLKEWLKHQEIAKFSGYSDPSLHSEFIIDELDLDIEINRLIELEKDIKQSELEESANSSHFDADYDNFFPSTPSSGRRLESSPEYVQEAEQFPFHNVYVTRQRAIKNASRWGNGKLLNFYGRFKPKIEDPVQIDSQNYIRSIASVVTGTEASRDPEDYLGIISGVVRRWDEVTEQQEVPTIKSIEDAYRIAATCFARSLSVGVLENKVAEAIAEINLAIDFIGANAKELDGPLEVGFIASLIDELRKLAEFYISETAEKFQRNSEILPKSAESFIITHPSLKRARQVADFRTLLAEKIKWYLANDLAHNMAFVKTVQVRGGNYDGRVSLAISEGPSLERLKEILRIYLDAVSIYQSAEEHDTPVYWEAAEALDESFHSKRNVVFGRDGRYFFTALKALKFGQKDSKQTYLVISSSIKLAAKNPGAHDSGAEARARKQNREKVIKYLQENGVTLDSNFIDTGYAGTIPEFVIECLSDAINAKLSPSEVDSRIKLMSSTVGTREQIARRAGQSEIEIIEDRPKSIARPDYLVVGPNGKIGPEIKPNSIEEQILAWTVEHVSMRNFAPRLDVDKRVRYKKRNPLKGYHFLQDASGQGFISTHPMELWADEADSKVLLKGGPEHTVRADFVGHQFFRKFGLLSPESELVKVGGELKIKMEFMEKYESGGISLPDSYKNSEDIQRGLLIDALLGQYDRTPWNIMLKRAEEADGPSVVFIDHGASLDSRARGGFKGFPDSFGIKDLQFILANPQFPGAPVNEAYVNFIEVKDGEIIVHNKPLLRELLQKLKTEITDEFINSVIYDAGYPEGQASTRRLQPILEHLSAEMKKYETNTNSTEYMHARDAHTTYRKAIGWEGEGRYFKLALRRRRDDILRLLTPLSE